MYQAAKLEIYCWTLPDCYTWVFNELQEKSNNAVNVLPWNSWNSKWNSWFIDHSAVACLA